MEDKVLHGDLIKIPPEQGPQPSSSGSLSRIFVSYGEAVLWAFPIAECRSWFDFLGHFNAFWPRTLEFLHHGQQVREQDWNKKYNLAKHTKVILALKIVDPPRPPQRGILKNSPSKEDKAEEAEKEETDKKLKPPDRKDSANPTPEASSSKTDPVQADDQFHVFTWLEDVQHFTGGPLPQIDNEALMKQITEVDKYLSEGTGFSDRKAYKDSRRTMRSVCFAYIENMANKVQKDAEHAPWRQDQFEDGIDIVNAADIVFSFFLPATYDAPVMWKFWGAIRELIEVRLGVFSVPSYRQLTCGNQMPSAARSHRPKPQENVIRTNAPEIRRYLRRLTQPIQSFNNLLSHAKAEDRAKVTVPDEFIKAWLHLTMGLIYSTQGIHLWREHTDNAEKLIKAGMMRVIESLSTYSLLERATVLPMEIASMTCLTLFQGITNNYASISETYSEYLNALVRNPSYPLHFVAQCPSPC
jgi:hypothetical protein